MASGCGAPGEVERSVLERGSAPSWAAEASGTGADLRAVWGSGAGDVFAVGAAGTILRSRGDGKWGAIGDGGGDGWVSIAGSAPDDVWVSGDPPSGQQRGRLIHSSDDGASWRTAGRWLGGGPLFVVSREELYLGGLHSRDGGRTFRSTPLDHVWAWGDDAFGWRDRFVDQAPTTLFSSRDGFHTWFEVPCGTPCGNCEAGALVTAIAAVARDDALLAFADDVLLRWHGGRVEAIAPPAPISGTNLALWASGPDDAWLAGVGGKLVHLGRGGSEWTPAAAPTGEDLLALWGASPRDVYAVGARGTIMHFH